MFLTDTGKVRVLGCSTEKASLGGISLWRIHIPLPLSHLSCVL